MTWDADTFTELIMEPDSIPDLLARFATLPEADRTSTRRAFGKALPEPRPTCLVAVEVGFVSVDCVGACQGVLGASCGSLIEG